MFLGAPRGCPGRAWLVGEGAGRRGQDPWRTALGGHSQGVSEIHCCLVAQSFQKHVRKVTVRPGPRGHNGPPLLSLPLAGDVPNRGSLPDPGDQ